jgi:hypothetical protein
MIVTKTENLSQYDKVTISCDICSKENVMLFRSAQRNFKKHEKHICKSCSFSMNAHKKPQCNSSFWTEEKKKSHGNSIKHSEDYQRSIANRDSKGEKNGMWGKTMSDESREKMSNSRKGKKQSEETIKKRMLTRKERSKNKPIKSLNQSVKQYVNSEYRWSRKILERDNFTCTECESKTQLDAHHIMPFAKILHYFKAQTCNYSINLYLHQSYTLTLQQW